jgi:hypothetical protein
MKAPPSIPVEEKHMADFTIHRDSLMAKLQEIERF